jgi:hypothetical protein
LFVCFRTEIAKRIVKAVSARGMKEIFVVVPFPVQIFARLSADGTIDILEQNPFRALPWPNPLPIARAQTVLVAHVHNSAALLPYWIRHHSAHFDHVAILDRSSTDESLDILRREAPSSWKVRTSRLGKDASAEELALEIDAVYAQFPGQWKMTLGVDEFLVHPNLRGELAREEADEREKVKPSSYGFPTYTVTGDDAVELLRFRSLPAQRHVVATTPPETTIISQVEGAPRAGAAAPAASTSKSGVVLRMAWSPWPQVKSFHSESNADALHTKFSAAPHVDLAGSRGEPPEMAAAARVIREMMSVMEA